MRFQPLVLVLVPALLTSGCNLLAGMILAPLLADHTHSGPYPTPSPKPLASPSATPGATPGASPSATPSVN